MNKLFIAISAAVLLCSVLVTAGCISDTAETNQGASLTGSWTAEENSLVTLVFNADGTYSGEAQVNLYDGTFTVTGNSLDMGDGVNRTKRAGPSELMEAEDSYMQRLTLVSSYAVSGNTLTLSDKDGKVLLTFVRMESAADENRNTGQSTEQLLYGTWNLAGNERVTIIFNQDGTYGGKAPVNSFGGSFSKGIPDIETQRTPLRLSDAFSTLLAGAPEDMEAEDAYYAALHSVVSYSVSATDGKSSKPVLNLFDKEGTCVLSFTRTEESAPSKPVTAAKRALPYGTWHLLAEDESAVSLTFDEDGTYYGHAQVNSFSGTYLVYGPALKPYGESLEMSPAVRTKMAAADPAVNAAENCFFAALESATEYSLSADENGFFCTLKLLDAEGDVLLTFVRGE